MHVGEIIEQIRIDRNMTIDDTIGNLMSRSTYDLFKKGETDIRVETVLLLFERLHLDERESILIAEEFKQNRIFYEFCDQVVNLYHSADLNGLKAYKMKLESLEEEIPIVSTLIHVANSFISMLEKNKVLPEDSLPLQQFFYESETWFIFELQLFARIGLLITKPDYIDMIYHNILKVIDSQSIITQSLAIHCAHVIIMLCFDYQEEQKIETILQRLLAIQFNEKYFYELQFNQFFYYLYQLIFKNNTEMNQELDRYFSFLNELGAVRPGISSWNLYVGYTKDYNIKQELKAENYPNLFKEK
ncbi:hypothetical protein [Globicatella sanguinis]|uniref:Rgg family transcriptional regulator n=1 Tax=Globicatella sanguinis TaxID=13076 RepID=UPI002543C2D4|nr:hypothetical protein [Globicatella sanguinis]MDK7631719.1 hypothetical protein [Globicatella sanguinis]WIK66036.1 hypothetical protein CYJ72_008930 [Globicatella sanguinis]WKT55441.1 hypothetical protein Q3C38_08930 [Globicatella sanguinis]